MSKLLIIGAGVEQIPAITKAQELGHYVIVTDMNDKAPGIKYANTAYIVSTTDIDGNVHIAGKEKIDGVLTVGSETAVPTVAMVAQALGLPGYSLDTALKATNKAKMRDALSRNGVRLSSHAIAKSIKDVISFAKTTKPGWVLKPVDNSGQRGTTIVNDYPGLQEAFEEALAFSPSKSVLIDKYVRGPEIHVTMLIIKGEIHFLAISDRITLNEKNFGIAVRHVGPALLEPDILENVKRQCILGVKALELSDGIATCELILSDGQPVVMEIAIRTPGGYLREVAMYLSGIDIIESTIHQSLNQEKTFTELITEEISPAVSVKFITQFNIDPEIKTITSIQNHDKVLKNKGIKLCRFHFEGRFDVPQLQNSVGRFGAIVAVGKSREEAIERSEIAFNILRINDKPLKEYTNYNRYNSIFN